MTETEQLAVLARIDELFRDHGIEYWLFGGWAVDFHAGSVTRAHHDLDLAVWLKDQARIAALLKAEGWQHAPEAGEDGYTGYQRGSVRLELAFLARDEDGAVSTPLRDGRAAWPDQAFGGDVAELLGVRARVMSLRALIADRSEARDDPAVAAKDRADVEMLSAWRADCCVRLLKPGSGRRSWRTGDPRQSGSIAPSVRSGCPRHPITGAVQPCDRKNSPRLAHTENLQRPLHARGGSALKPRITVLTLGVNDLEASLRFYRDGLGLATEGIVGQEFEYGTVGFFDLQAGLRLALWPRASIARDTGLPVQPPSATDLTIGHNVNSKEEVDVVMEQAGRAGAKIVKPARDTFYGGYAGYFQDPDGHLWEVAWNPAWPVAE